MEVPLLENALSHSAALLWLAFLAELFPTVPPSELKFGFAAVAELYDMDHAAEIETHLETDDESDESDESDEPESDEPESDESEPDEPVEPDEPESDEATPKTDA